MSGFQDMRRWDVITITFADDNGTRRFRGSVLDAVRWLSRMPRVFGPNGPTYEVTVADGQGRPTTLLDAIARAGGAPIYRDVAGHTMIVGVHAAEAAEGETTK